MITDNLDWIQNDNLISRVLYSFLEDYLWLGFLDKFVLTFVDKYWSKCLLVRVHVLCFIVRVHVLCFIKHSYVHSVFCMGLTTVTTIFNTIQLNNIVDVERDSLSHTHII